MKKLLLFVFCACMILNCKDENLKNEATVNLIFKLKYGGEPLVMFSDYQYPTGEKLFFNRFSFFTSEVQLGNGSGFQQIEDIAYHNLTNSHTSKDLALKGLSFAIPNVIKDNYKSLKFSIGVPKADNDKTPAKFNEKPLSDQAEYWGDWKSYIFSRTEGQFDSNGDGVVDEDFSLHTGANEAFKTIELPINLNLKDAEEGTIVVEIDVKKQFGISKTYDIKANPSIHSRSQLAQTLELANNLSIAFSAK